MKTCTRCHTSKPTSEFSRRDGDKFQSRCKACMREVMRAAYQADPEKFRSRSRDYKAAHPTETQATMTQWRERNRERELAYQRAYNEANRERKRLADRARRAGRPKGYYADQYRRRRDYYRQYSEANQDRIREIGARWRQENPDKGAEKSNRYRARKLRAPIVEKIDRRAIIERDDSICYLCGRRLRSSEITLDHVVPLVRGGNHTADNVRVACRTCNCRKHTRTLDELFAE